MFNTKYEKFNFDFELTPLENNFLECSALLRRKNLSKMQDRDGITDTEKEAIDFMLSTEFNKHIPWFLSNSSKKHITEIGMAASLYLIESSFCPLINKFSQYLDPDSEENIIMLIRPLLNYVYNFLDLEEMKSDNIPFVSYTSNYPHSLYCDSLQNIKIPTTMALVPPFQECSKGIHCDMKLKEYDLSQNS